MSEQNEYPIPPWKMRSKINGTIGYRDGIPEGLFLEQACIIAARMNDINLTLKHIDEALTYISEWITEIVKKG